MLFIFLYASVEKDRNCVFSKTSPILRHIIAGLTDLNLIGEELGLIFLLHISHSKDTGLLSWSKMA